MLELQRRQIELMERLVEQGAQHPPMAQIAVVSAPSQLRQPETSAIEAAVNLLLTHPDYKDKTARELEALTQISRSTWSRAKQRLNLGN